MEWQPIETAPKDGTWFLGWRSRKEPQDQIEAWKWNEDFELEYSGWMNAHDDADFYESPEFWMPLPNPPKHKDDGDAE
jgi:hypothetical protein